MKKFIQNITNWEAWPFQILYIPMSFFWGWYMLRSGAVWFFTPSNPKLTFGGMEGEPKKEMYDLLPKHLYPETFNILPTLAFDEVLKTIAASTIEYPFIVKPEMGGQGILFRKVDTEAELKHYHTLTPVEYIIQKMVHYPVEVSVFHIKHPNQPKGVITGFLHKIPMQVLGTGKHTLAQLVKKNPKALKRWHDLKKRHQPLWHSILPKDEKYLLSYAANHNKGAHFVDLKNEIDDNLLAIFDKLSIDIDDFFYGRYDIMCSSVADLKAGKNFTILEYNGCGAEPNHFYDTGYTLLGAYKEIIKHWQALYTISKYNAKSKNLKPWGLFKGYRFLRDTKKMYRIMKDADAKMG